MSRIEDPAQVEHHQSVVSPSFEVMWFSLRTLLKENGEIDSEMGIARLGQWENMYRSVWELWLLLGMCLK